VNTNIAETALLRRPAPIRKKIRVASSMKGTEVKKLREKKIRIRNVGSNQCFSMGVAKCFRRAVAHIQYIHACLFVLLSACG